jgi:hypothetical protein
MDKGGFEIINRNVVCQQLTDDHSLFLIGIYLGIFFFKHQFKVVKLYGIGSDIHDGVRD